MCLILWFSFLTAASFGLLHGPEAQRGEMQNCSLRDTTPAGPLIYLLGLCLEGSPVLRNKNCSCSTNGEACVECTALCCALSAAGGYDAAYSMRRSTLSCRTKW